MRVRDAANIGRSLVIVHLIMSVCLNMVNVMRMMPAVGRNMPLWYLITTSLHIVTTVILDLGLLIVFGSLARTEEQLLRDQPEG